MSGGKGGISLNQIRSWLITALCVFVAGNILLAILRPLLPFILLGIVLVTVVGWFYRKGTH